MRDDSAWASAGWEANRRRQHREFRALPLREKLVILEALGEVTAFFAERRRARGQGNVSHPASRAADDR